MTGKHENKIYPSSTVFPNTKFYRNSSSNFGDEISGRTDRQTDKLSIIQPFFFQRHKGMKAWTELNWMLKVRPYAFMVKGCQVS